VNESEIAIAAIGIAAMGIAAMGIAAMGIAAAIFATVTALSSSSKRTQKTLFVPTMQSIRLDLDAIFSIVPPSSSVLDLGCGDGTLLARLVAEKSVSARGVELSEANVRACVSKGLSVRQGNIEEGLADYRAGAFDYVILSQTIAYLDQPRPVVEEMLRVGKRAVISFDNSAYWRWRWGNVTGKIMSEPLCEGGPRARTITLRQFDEFVDCLAARVVQKVYVSRSYRPQRLATLLAREAVYVIERR
jgi:methionine biosynthesis protein MetW